MHCSLQHTEERSTLMPDLLTVGPDEIMKVWRDNITHTFKGERCEGAPFETLFVQFHGCRTVQIDIRKSRQPQRDPDVRARPHPVA